MTDVPVRPGLDESVARRDGEVEGEEGAEVAVACEAEKGALDDKEETEEGEGRGVDVGAVERR